MSQGDERLREIRTEYPTSEIWSMLGYFESKYNCQKYLEEKFGADLENIGDIANSLSFTMSSAQEYYEAAEDVSSLTRPLLIFYGMSDLAKVLFISKHGKKSPSINHGLLQCREWTGQISELSIKVVADGTFPQLHGCYDKKGLVGIEFNLKELTSLVPEIKVEFETIYKEKSRALLTVNNEYGIEYGIEIVDTELIKYEELEARLNQISGFSNRYRVFNRNEERLFLDRNNPRENPDMRIRSLSGDKYLILPLLKSEALSIPEMSVHYLIMFALGILSRYQPEEWGKGIRGEETGDIYLLNKFLDVTKRKFPNLILNELRNREFIFTSPLAIKEETQHFTRKQLQEIYDHVMREIHKEMRGY